MTRQERPELQARPSRNATDAQHFTHSLTIPDFSADPDTLTAALTYAEDGWYVLPVKRGSKHPGSVVRKGWHTQSSRDPHVITAWFAGTDYGIALHVGRSGSVVFDVDHPDKFPERLWHHLLTAPYHSTRPSETRRGHYIFAAPPGRLFGNGAGKLGGAWGEVRGQNAVIIVWPSIHPSPDGKYDWHRTGRVPVLHDEIAELLPDASPAEDAATDEAVAAFITQHATGTRPDVLNGLRKALVDKIEAGESVHMSAVSVVTGAMKEAAAGYYPAQYAADVLTPIFINAVALGGSTGKVRTGHIAKSEWDGILAWAVAQALAADPADTTARTDEKMPPEATTFETPSAPTVDRTPTERVAALENTDTQFRKWLGDDYDTDAAHLVLAAAAVQQMDGDPLWVHLVSGSGNAKTETVQSLQNHPWVHIVSTIASEGALLSATSKRERSKTATGGLLREIGDNGILVVKDFTSIISMGRELRGAVLAALREIYDGAWNRNVGTDGGRTLEWVGRVTMIGAVTTAWDTAHSVIAAMGDRFVLMRLDSTTHRVAAGRRAIGNTGNETEMRDALAAAAADVLAGAGRDPIQLNDQEVDILLAAADLVTRARTAVEYDYHGNVSDAHAPEMPTRFAKQLAQIVRGGLAIGMSREAALGLALRCARDSMPPLRLAIIDYLADHPASGTSDIRKGIGKPRNTVDRQLQALHMLDVLECREEVIDPTRTRWLYSLANDIDPDAVKPQNLDTTLEPCSRNVSNRVSAMKRGVSEEGTPRIPSDITGTSLPVCRDCHSAVTSVDSEFCATCVWFGRDGAA